MKTDFNTLQINDNKYLIRKGTLQDEKIILGLYRRAIGTEFCTWSLDYPNEDTFYMDVNDNNLFCICNEEAEIIGAISIDKDENTDRLECWNKSLGKMGELSRMVIRQDYQNKGIAPEFIKYVMEIMKSRGYKSVHYLVSKHHKKALKAYEKLEFTLVGESDLFEHEWFCYEKIL